MATATPSGNPRQPIFFTTEEKIKYLVELCGAGHWIFPLYDLVWTGAGPACRCSLGPCCPGPGKHPSIKWSAPPDPADPHTWTWIRATVERWPERGWGCHLGLSGAVVMDVDPRNGGVASLAQLLHDQHVELSPNVTHTGGGGLHYWFRASDAFCPRRGFRGANGRTSTCIQLAPGVELLSGQHYVVLAYSPHASGGWYRKGA